jgi:hypothetical protein
MGIETYKKKIELYIKDREGKSKNVESSKGLLSPKSGMSKGMGDETDPVNTIGEFVYALRKKRQELQITRSKK